MDRERERDAYRQGYGGYGGGYDGYSGSYYDQYHYQYPYYNYEQQYGQQEQGGDCLRMFSLFSPGLQRQNLSFVP